jgi:hydrogenase small subunit
MAVLGAMGPRLEELLSGHLTHIPRIQLVHPSLALDAGDEYLAALDQAVAGELDPFLLVIEGALFDESRAGEGSFSGCGQRAGRRITVEQRVLELAPMAAAVIAIGTCATWGGIPAAEGNVTGAMGLRQFLTRFMPESADGAFRSRSGLPLVNVPGCAPSGDAFIEVISYTLLHLGGIVPLDLDDQDRPRWLYADSVPLTPTHRAQPTRPAPIDATADCPVPRVGWINHLGGCAAVGGACVGCTRPDFPDVTLRLVIGR